jgi:hypothetical protein
VVLLNAAADMTDLSDIYVELEELRDDLAMVKRAYGGLSFPKAMHEQIRQIGYQNSYNVQVPLGNGSNVLIFDTFTHVNGDFELSILDACGTRMWRGVFKEAA